MKKTDVRKTLDDLSLKDTYSLLMFVIFKLQSVPEMATLSQLVYLLDENTLIKLLKYYEGQTITIPKLKDLENLIYALSLYQSVDIEKQDINELLSKIPKSSSKDILDIYEKIKVIMQEYQFV